MMVDEETTSTAGGGGGGEARVTKRTMRGSTSTSETDETDQWVATALQGMTLEDRDEIYHEIHGVVDEVKETPQLIQASFFKMKQELDSLVLIRDTTNSNSSTTGKRTENNEGGGGASSVSSRLDPKPFQYAQEQNHDYVHSRFHYLMFLRNERFDCEKAAVRMIYFFQLKELFFGKAAACQDIHQGLLSKTELAYLNQGFLQVLPSRDRSGRVLVAHFFYMIDYDTLENLGRMYLYISWSLALDEESQRKGAVMIQWGNISGKPSSTKNQHQTMDWARFKMNFLLIMGCPIRTTAFHHCSSTEQLYKVVLSWAFKFIPKRYQARNKFHVGTPQECTYFLMAYGIPPDANPINDEGQVKTKLHKEWMKARAIQEQWIQNGKIRVDTVPAVAAATNPATPMVKELIVVPDSKDIVLGRGKRIHSHPGNIQLNRLIDQAIPQYDASRKTEKTAMTNEMIRNMQEDWGGRFLLQDTKLGVWMIAPEDTVKIRVSQRFRSRKSEQDYSGSTAPEQTTSTSSSLFSISSSVYHAAKRPKMG